MTNLSGKTLFVSGGSRGIGLAIAKRAAQDGANIVIAAKTKEPHPRLPGTIYTAAKEIEAAGGNALPMIVDIRFEDQVDTAIEKAVSEFGGIDILVNNASAINLSDTDSWKNINKSARNIKDVKLIKDEGTNIYDILKYKNLIITSSSAKKIQERVLNEKN
mgnify:CR=1 FL=1